MTGAGSTWPPGLPAPLTRFVGRQRELADVARDVAAHRLVTLTGAGGVGKTRLAIEVAAGLAADFGDGADLVDLSTATDPALLPVVAAQALGVEDRADTGIEERLVRVLRNQHRLLVMDNCEHLRGHCADLVTAVLGSCPQVVVLATSRESLGVPGEVTWRVPSLAFPWPEHPPAVADLESFEAAALFLDRARGARPGLTIGPGEVAAVTSICFHLDGIPLALELAAARVGALSMKEIAERLTGSPGLLARTGSGPARHQTLQASMVWSHQLLSKQEEALFRRLAVFAGGWGLEAAEAVAAVPPVATEDVAGLLAALVDKSLVQAEQMSSSSRYRLLEVIRGFASERLAEAGELGQVRARHADYYTALAERCAPMLLGPEQAHWAGRLDAETPNLRAARHWCEEDPTRSGIGLRLASGLWDYWHIRGCLVEAMDWLEKALAHDSGPEHARGAALLGLGATAALGGDHDRSRELYTRSVEAFRAAGDPHGEARALANLGNSLVLSHAETRPAEAYGSSLALARQLGDIWCEAYALFSLGFIMAASGDVTRAWSPLTTASDLFGRTGDRRGYGYARLAVGQAMAWDGKGAEAVAAIFEAVGIFETLPDRWGLLWGASLLAPACAAMGDWPRAVVLLGVVDSMSERTGGRPLERDQASLDEMESRAVAELGPAFQAARHAGRVLGRGDQVTTALWPARAASGDPSAGPGRAAGAGAAPGHELPLTGREREVAELIAHGLTNRQIGRRLFIAERTVDTHVGRILEKLGCTSRAQVAAIVAAAAALSTTTTGADDIGSGAQHGGPGPTRGRRPGDRFGDLRAD
jgi:predicted ATPase/DNA-binding CsgD family transcriptional regulator